jgi:hypothetical protein
VNCIKGDTRNPQRIEVAVEYIKIKREEYTHIKGVLVVGDARLNMYRAF